MLVDEAGLMLVCDAVRAYRDERAAKTAADAQAWADAHSAATAALAAAKAGRA